MRSGGWALRVVPAVVALAGATGCGFANDLARQEDPPAQAAAPTSVAPAVSTPDPDAPRVIVDGDVVTTGADPIGHLVVTVGPVRDGLVPPVPNFSENCLVDGPSLQYVAVDFAFTTVGPDAGSSSGLAAHVGIGTGPATPADIGDVGIFVESGDGSQVYCADYPPLPTEDKFWNQMGAETITAWVVLDRAITPATPDGRGEVFPTLQLRISDLRRLTQPTSVQTLTPGTLTLGATCAEDPDAICVPLG